MIMFLHDLHELMLISMRNSKENRFNDKENKPRRIAF